MLSDKKIAIAILNYNGLELLKKFLPSVIKFSNNKISSIYIIDNNSHDKSLVFVRKIILKLKLLKTKKIMVMQKVTILDYQKLIVNIMFC